MNFSQNIDFRSLDRVPFSVLFEGFQSAFHDYEIQISRQELQKMLVRRGFVPGLSFGAFDGEELIAFTFNGIGNYHGIKTAYDTGTGTSPAFRGQGLATEIFNYSIPFLKNVGVSQYLLEVLQHNEKAVSVYKKLGFEVTREFNYFVQEKEKITSPAKSVPSGYQLRPFDLKLDKELLDFCDFYPSWQNSFDAISRNREDFKFVGAFYREKIVGYCIFEISSGDITQIAVETLHRRKGLASAMLNHVLPYNQHPTLKCINSEVNCTSITGLLQSFSIPLKGKQYEMMKQL